MESAGHKYVMRGQVLEVTNNMAYLCIGSKDGTQVGQELTAYRFVKTAYPFPKSGLPSFRKVEAGKVKISEIVDEHYANARVLSGTIEVNDVVELNR
jgi:hypothetical protein